MKKEDIKKCIRCNKGVMHTGLPLFWVIKLERFGIDVNAVDRQVGLEKLCGVGLAGILGPNEDIASSITGEMKAVVCESCAMEPLPLAYWAEVMSDRDLKETTRLLEEEELRKNIHDDHEEVPAEVE